MLMDQLRSPEAGSARRPMATPRTPVAAPPAAAAAAATTTAAEAAGPRAPSTQNLSLLSHSEWLEFKQRWLACSHMYWQFFGIRRTREEKRVQQRVQHALHRSAQPDDQKEEDEEADADACVDLPLTQAEKADFELSPHCRTFFLPSHSAQYPLTLPSIEGLALQLDGDATVYQLRIGDAFNSSNPSGADGAEMWEAFCLALLEPKMTSVTINLKTSLEILAALPMPKTVIQRVYQAANDHAASRQPARSGIDAPATSLVPPPSSASTSFLVLIHLLSTTSRSLQMVDVRVAHWLLMPTDENLLEVKDYTNWYVRKAGAHSTRSDIATAAATGHTGGASSVVAPMAARSIPCSPDKKPAYAQEVHMRHQHRRIHDRNPYAPLLPSLAPVRDASWNHQTIDRFRYAQTFAEASSTVRQLVPLYTTLLRQLISLGLHRAFREIELPLVPALAHMELVGMGFNKPEMAAHLDRMQQRYQYLEHQARLLVHAEIDFTKPSQYIALMQATLEAAGVPIPTWWQQAQRQREAKKSNRLSGIPRLLDELSSLHPLAAILREYRLLSFSLGHLLPIPTRAIRHPELRQDRIHATLLNVTETGRLSCQEPNIQSVPKQTNYQTVRPTTARKGGEGREDDGRWER